MSLTAFNFSLYYNFTTTFAQCVAILIFEQVKEKICLLYHVEVLEGKTPSMVLGNGYVDEVGKRGLIPLLRDVLNKSSALVITRPPETWSVTLKGEEKKR